MEINNRKWRNRLKVEDLNNNYNTSYYRDINKTNIEEFFKNNQQKNKMNFHFNLFDYYNNSNKMKFYNRLNFKIKLDSIKKSLNKQNNLLTFDAKLEAIDSFTNKSAKHLYSLSKKNKIMLGNIINIYDVYKFYDK